jgi:hypothetical protein
VYGSVSDAWSRQSKILAADGVADDNFGVSVAVYDTAAMIGAYLDDDKGSDTGISMISTTYYQNYMLIYMYVGSVYVYGSVGSIWSRQSKILAADGAANDWFGSGVSIYGITAMIGSRLDDDKDTDAGIINNNKRGHIDNNIIFWNCY